MITMKLRVINEFGVSEFLGAPDEVEVYFPYEQSGPLVKRMSFGAVKILDDAKGEIAVDLSSFEIQGLFMGDDQNFTVKIKKGSRVREAIFPKALNVRQVNVDGEMRKVIVRK